MALNLSLAETCELLRLNDNFTLITHASPDGDTLGSGYALAEILRSLGKKVRVICPDVIGKKFYYIISQNDEIDESNEFVVAVDVADAKLLGCLREVYGNRVDLCIDHHISNTEFSKHLYLESSAAAACECVFNIACELGVEITSTIATAIYTGISTDTGCFRFSNTSAQTHRIAASLFDAGVNAAELDRNMFETKSRARLEIERLALSEMEFYFDGQCAVIKITDDMLKKSGCEQSDIDGINAISRTVEGVLAGITLREKEPTKIKVSVRTYEPISASEICAKFGGGGHARAAGCEFLCDIETAKSQLLAVVQQALGKN